MLPKGLKNVLLDVECQEWQVEYKRDPVSVDKEKEGQKAVNCSFRNDICVQTVAKVDWIDVVTVMPPY